jgi:hypothetical protein
MEKETIMIMFLVLQITGTYALIMAAFFRIKPSSANSARDWAICIFWPVSLAWFLGSEIIGIIKSN